MDEYYRLGFARKPEHLQWYLPGEPYRPSDFAHFDYGDEAQARLVAYDELAARADRLYVMMPARLRDAFYELVAYPVRGAALANRRFFCMEKSVALRGAGARERARLGAAREEAGERLAAETTYYNEKLASGKWRHMMSRGDEARTVDEHEEHAARGTARRRADECRRSGPGSASPSKGARSLCATVTAARRSLR